MTLEDFLELAERRKSVRAYRPDPVPEAVLKGVLRAASLAPSACNRQPWKFVLVTDAARRRALGMAYDREWFWTAPAIVAVCVEPGTAWTRAYDGKNYAFVDGAIAMDHLTLAAAAAGDVLDRGVRAGGGCDGAGGAGRLGNRCDDAGGLSGGGFGGAAAFAEGARRIAGARAVG